MIVSSSCLVNFILTSRYKNDCGIVPHTRILKIACIDIKSGINLVINGRLGYLMYSRHSMQKHLLFTRTDTPMPHGPRSMLIYKMSGWICYCNINKVIRLSFLLLASHIAPSTIANTPRQTSVCSTCASRTLMVVKGCAKISNNDLFISCTISKANYISYKF